MIDSYVPDVEYVEGLVRRADEALESVEGVWSRGAPVEVRDDAGFFHTARYVAYRARTAEPDDDEMKLFRELISGLPNRYELPSWQAKRTSERIVAWVKDPARVKFIGGWARAPGRHAHRVFISARHAVRVAAAGVLQGRGRPKTSYDDDIVPPVPLSRTGISPKLERASATGLCTGLRLVNGGGRADVEAAHIWPVAEGGPDIVQNSIALSATCHWLFDRHLISLRDDYGRCSTSKSIRFTSPPTSDSGRDWTSSRDNRARFVGDSLQHA